MTRYSGIPDVRDGLTREERVVLHVLHETQKERGGRNVPTAMLWGRVWYYLLMGDLDQAAHWFGEMIERRDPFVMLHLRSRVLQPLREHPRWPELAGRMRLEG